METLVEVAHGSHVLSWSAQGGPGTPAEKHKKLPENNAMKKQNKKNKKKGDGRPQWRRGPRLLPEVASFLDCDRTASSSSSDLVDDIFVIPGCALSQSRINVEEVDPNIVVAALICVPALKRDVGDCEGTMHTNLPLFLGRSGRFYEPTYISGTSPGPHKGAELVGTGKRVLAKASSTVLTGR